MSMPALPLPAEPTGNRFALVTPDDNSAPVLIVTILSLIFTTLIFAARLLIVKWKRHGYDDGLLALGHLSALGHWIAIFFALQKGLGKSLRIISAGQQAVIGKALLTGRALLFPSIYFSKLSILLIIRSLFNWETRWKRLLLDAAIFVVTLWGIGATLATSISCPVYNTLDENNPCSGQALRLRVVLILDMVTEGIIFGLPVVFIYTFEIADSYKLLVIAAFASRLPLLAFSTMYLLSWTSYIATNSTGTAIVPAIIWQEIFIGYSLMSATIPCLKSFVEDFRTGGMRYPQEDTSIVLYESENSYGLTWLEKKIQLKTGQLEEVAPNLQAPVRNSKRFSSLRNANVGTSISSQASEQPIIAIVMQLF
ncbi:hypothetical protein F5884DRAFT_265992 [Xylogone sp. PMI_703]|nr:hypothetical protein F5884DRAFT_265992 [Xylogone sp. PMI_703]